MLPREKYLKNGIDNLSDMELIAIVVGRGIKGKNFLSVSKSVVGKIRKQIEKGKELNVECISEVDGVGIVTAMRILCGIELGRRLYEAESSEKCLIHNSEEAFSILKYIVGLFLNSRFELLQKKIICIGSLDGVSILPRDIIIPALEVNASSVIIAHNHPSGNASPSREDVVITERIKEGLELVGLNFLDHIVIGRNEWKRIEL